MNKAIEKTKKYSMDLFSFSQRTNFYNLKALNRVNANKKTPQIKKKSSNQKKVLKSKN